MAAMTKDELIAELLRRGVRLYVDACGCCESPSLIVWLDDAPTPVFDEEARDACLNMDPDRAE